MKAVAVHQKTAPKPPRQIAVETPMIFPVPTREAVELKLAGAAVKLTVVK